MNRKIAVLILALSTVLNAQAWGRLGHATVAKIAEDHLTAKAKAEIARYLDNESIVKYASYADDYKSTVLLDAGFDPVDAKRVSSYPHTFEVNMDFKPFRGRNDNGRYVKNCIETLVRFEDELKNRRDLTDSMVRMRIILMTHFVGDMHCPEHIRYNPEDMTIGYYKVRLGSKELQYHKIWDAECLVSRHPWGFLDTAYLLDTKSDEEIEKIVKGTPYDWGEDAARKSYPIHQFREGASLKKSFLNDWSELTDSQIRNAGYRLAHLLNGIFDR